MAEGARREPLSKRLCNLFVYFFAGWTLLGNAVVLFGGNLFHLYGSVAAAAVLLPLLYLFPRAKRKDTAAEAAPQVPDIIEQKSAGTASLDDRRSENNALMVSGAMGASALIATAYAFTKSILLFWFLSVFYFASVVILISFGKTKWEAPPESRRGEKALWATAGAAVLVVLFALQPNWDDCFYTNAAVTAADHPDDPLMLKEGLHGIEGARFQPLYRVQSLTALAGALSHLTRLPAGYYLNLIFPCIFALFIPLAFAALFRTILPDRWIWATAATLFLLVYMGGGEQPFGDYAFYRLQQGKSVLLSVLLPLSAAYSVRFARKPRARNWFLLAGCNIAGLGMNPTAIFLLPVASGLALAACWRPNRKATGVFLVGLLASAYLAGAGLAIRAETARMLDTAYSHPSPDPMERFLNFSGPEMVEGSLQYVLGGGPALFAVLFCMLTAWSLGRSSQARLLLVLPPAGLLLIFLNPYTAQIIAGKLTSYSTYWRVLWLVPMPALAAVVLTSPFRPRKPFSNGKLEWWRLALGVALWIGFMAIVPISRTVGNILELRPGFRTAEPEYSVAAALNEAAKPASYVLAPNKVSLWVPTFHRHSYPLKARHNYLAQLVPLIGEEDFDDRVFLTDYLSGRDDHGGALSPQEPQAAERFERGLRRYRVGAVCLDLSVPWADRIQSVLKGAGFQRPRKIEDYEIWSR